MSSPAPASAERLAPRFARRALWGACGALGLILFWVLWSAFGRDPHAVPFGLLGAPAPGFALADVRTGEVVRLEQFRGRPVVLNFWATWCHPCKAEQPVLDAAHGAFGDRVVFLGIVANDTRENVDRALREHPPRYAQLLDPATVAVDYAVSGVPETYFIDRRGVIAGKVPGAIDAQTLHGAIVELLR